MLGPEFTGERRVQKGSKCMAWLLCLLFGWAGLHRCYMGRVSSGVVYFFTLGWCSFGWLSDACIMNELWRSKLRADEERAPMVPAFNTRGSTPSLHSVSTGGGGRAGRGRGGAPGGPAAAAMSPMGASVARASAAPSFGYTRPRPVAMAAPQHLGALQAARERDAASPPDAASEAAAAAAASAAAAAAMLADPSSAGASPPPAPPPHAAMVESTLL